MKEVIILVISLFSSSGWAQQPDANQFCLSSSGLRNHKDLYANPEDCHSYFQCFYVNETQAIGYKRDCPSGTFWHDLHLQCVPEGPTACSDRCRDEETATLGCYADSSSCSSYFSCSNEISYKFCCPPNTRFNPDECSCVEDDTCQDNCTIPAAPPTTILPPTFINRTLCIDSYGSTLKPVNGNPLQFEIADLENPENSQVMDCPPGTSFLIDTCACDITVAIRNPASARQCSLYLPFDGDADDDSHFKASTQLVGLAEVNYATWARGFASLKVYGGHVEVPAFKNYDMASTASWCFFYRCGLDANNASRCTTSGGILSNNGDAAGSDYSFIFGSKPTDRIDGRFVFKNPKSSYPFDAYAQPDAENLNEFQQVCIVHDETLTQVYVNRKLISSFGTERKFATSSNPLLIGSDPILGSFSGYIDEVLFCKFALTEDEVRAHFQGNDALVDAGLIPQSKRRHPKIAPEYGDLEAEWLLWCDKYKQDPTDAKAKAAFAETLQEAKDHNALYKAGRMSTPMILSKLAAVPHSEINHRFGLASNYEIKEVEPGTKLKMNDCSKLPDNFDWCEFGVVAPIKDQGTCGSCWSFAAATAIESQLAIRKGMKVPELSNQQMMDCSKNQGNKGCQGGLMTRAYQYMATVEGLHSFAAYPYTKTDTEACRVDPKREKLHGNCFNYKETIGDECNLAFDLMATGPLSIGMECGSDFINAPPGVIYNTTFCRRPRAALNHAMVIVGFGTDKNTGIKWWKIRNSWGENWGERGYIRVLRNDRWYPNVCGLASLVSSPILSGASLPNTFAPSFVTAAPTIGGANEELIS